MYITQFKKNYKIILVTLTIVFLYFLFYTDYIIHNQPQKQQFQNQRYQKYHQYHQYQYQQQQQPSEEIKHVKFDDRRNLEILLDSEKDRINIDYRAPQLTKLQQISRCTYPMNSMDQMNTRDCTVTGTCITKFSPQEWFNEQRAAKYDLPGFNGDSSAQFKFNENIVNDMMMQNMNTNTNDQESFTNTALNTNSYMKVNMPNAPFLESPIGRGSMPYDLCRSCTVGVCDGNTCGSVF
jgi:hypothetical protein